MKRILVIDNYDSFTFNLVHYIKQHNGVEVDVVRNDKIAVGEVYGYDGILLSPGPGVPKDAGNLLAIIDHYKSTKRIFGVCLGLQAIGEVFGGTLENIKTVYHGLATPMHIQQPKHYIFKGLPDTFDAGRYHSWVVSEKNFPSDLQVDAIDDDGLIMALSHKHYDICGVQFHPESILTPIGKQIVFNWLKND